MTGQSKGGEGKIENREKEMGFLLAGYSEAKSSEPRVQFHHTASRGQWSSAVRLSQGAAELCGCMQPRVCTARYSVQHLAGTVDNP